MRTHYCGTINLQQLDQKVTICGWAQRRRDHGGVIFIDVRDISGIVQVVCNPDDAKLFTKAETIRNEYCLQITAVVKVRPEGTVNLNLPTGEIELIAVELNIINASIPLPFVLDEENLS